jgi:Tol biopolymer transport system component
MNKSSSIRLSRPTVTLLSVVAAGILVLPVVMLTRRKQVADSSIVPETLSAKLRLREEVSRARSIMEKICFLRGGWVYLRDVPSGKDSKLVEGVSPNLAPTGESVVFISVKENEDIMNRMFPPPGRLRILNLQTNEVRDFSALRETRVGDSIWSNDGTRIAAWARGPETTGPYIAILNTKTGELEKKIIQDWNEITHDEGMYLDSWTPNDQSLLFHTLGGLYEVSIADGLVQKLPVDDIFRLGEISSATQFSFSSDRRRLLFDRMISTPEEPPTSIISILDLTTKTVRRVTPKTVNGMSPVWLPSNRDILFTRTELVNDQWRPSICKIAVDGSGLSVVISDADYPSYSSR